jgi:hypothetical protein
VVAEKIESFKFLMTDQSQQLWGTDKQIPLVMIKFLKAGTVRNISTKNQQNFLEKILILLFTAQ